MAKVLWNRDFVLLCLARASSSTIFSLLTTTMAFYASVALEADSGLSGVITGVFVLTSLPSRIWAGALTSRIGEKRLLLTSSLVFLLCIAGYFFIFDIALLIVLRGIHGAAFGVISNALSTAAAKEVPQERLGEGMGFFSLGSTVAYAVGPFAGITFSQASCFAEMYALCAACALLLVLCAALLRDQALQGDGIRHARGQAGSWRQSAFESSALPISAVSGVLNVCYVSVTAFVNLYALAHGLDAFAPWFFVVYAVLLLVSRPSMGKLFDAKGQAAAVFPLFLVCALALFMLGTLPNGFGFLGAAALLSFGYGSLFTNLQTQVIIDQPAERMGVCTATFFVFADIGLGLGPMMWGFALEHISYDAMYLIAGAAMLALFALYPRVSRCFSSDAKKRQRGNDMKGK